MESTVIDKTIKLKKMSTYENFMTSLSKLFDEIQDNELNVNDFRNQLNNFAVTLTNEIDGYEDFFIEMISCLESPEQFISHSLNTAIFSFVLSLHLKIDVSNQQNLIIASLLHDIGKIDFNDFIKVKYLYREEDKDQIYANHPKWGERILASHLKLQPDITRLVLNHHEQIDGTGFPRKLKDGDLTLYDNILITANLIEKVLQKTHYACMDTLSQVIKALLQTHGEKFTPAIQGALNEIFIIKKDERTHHRYNQFAKCTMEDLMRSLKLTCEIYNVSPGGLEISTTEELHESSIYKISSRISPNLLLKDKFCKVAWGKRHENKNFYGIKFDTPTNEIIRNTLNELEMSHYN